MGKPIDWSKGADSDITMEVRLGPEAPKKAAFWSGSFLIVRGSTNSRRAAGLHRNDLLHRVREAAVRSPEYHAELLRMVASLPVGAR